MHIKDNEVMTNSNHHGFTKVQNHLSIHHGFTKVQSDLAVFYIEMNASVNREREENQLTLTLANLLIQFPLLIFGAKLEKEFGQEDYRVETGPALSGFSTTSKGITLFPPLLSA